MRPNNRLLPPSQTKASPPRGKNTKSCTAKKTDTVKMWFKKSIVQVRLPSSIKKGYTCKGAAKTTLVPRCELTTPSSEHCSYNGTCPSDEASFATSSVDETTYHFTRHAIRSNYMDKSIEAKRKVNFGSKWNVQKSKCGYFCRSFGCYLSLLLNFSYAGHHCIFLTRGICFTLKMFTYTLDLQEFLWCSCWHTLVLVAIRLLTASWIESFDKHSWQFSTGTGKIDPNLLYVLFCKHHIKVSFL